jgi:GT2 family glycosyltransferase
MGKGGGGDHRGFRGSGEQAMKEERRPWVSAIIPNWNRAADLREAIAAIKGQTYPVSEIIVVDNNSSDDSVRMLREEFPEVITICSPQNAFINSLNIAAKTATGDLILHQDNDGVLAPDALEHLIRCMQTDPSIAVAYSRNLYYDSGETYDPMRWFSREEHESDGCFDAPSFHGNGSLLRKDVLEEVGYFEPDIHLFERSLSAKVFDRGYRVVYHPASVIRHKISKEIRNPGYRLYVNMTGGWWFLARFYPAGRALKKGLLYLVYFKLYALKHRTFRDFFRGIVDSLLGLPEILRRRSVVSEQAIKCLECKPYEMSMIKYGAWDTLKRLL